jgi:hypothetical protein
MDNYRIAPEGNRFQVSRTTPDGPVWLIGRFRSRDNAQLWIEDQLKMANRRDLISRRAQTVEPIGRCDNRY